MTVLTASPAVGFLPMKDFEASAAQSSKLPMLLLRNSIFLVAILINCL
jgi:hypothetical protein